MMLRSVRNASVSFAFAVAMDKVHEGGEAQDDALLDKELMDCSIGHVTSGTHILDGFPMSFELALLVLTLFLVLRWSPRLSSFADVVGCFGCC